jgi:hypothetical protein
MEKNLTFSPYLMTLEEHIKRFCLVKLYVFAEKMVDVSAKSASLEAYLKTVAGGGGRSDNMWIRPSIPEVSTIYKGPIHGSFMRRLLVDVFAWAITNNFRDEDRELLEEFFGELLRNGEGNRQQGKTR